MNSDSKYILLDRFSPFEVSKLIEAFQNEHIEFAIESNDEGLKNQRPSNYPGSFGRDVYVDVYVDGAHYEHALNIRERVFGPLQT